MTAPADLEAVKAMLVDALNEQVVVEADEMASDYVDKDGNAADHIIRHSYNCFEPISMTKLAATVSEWFAARTNN